MSRMPRARNLMILALVAMFCLGLTAEAWARAGGGKSMGSTGSRSFSTSQPSSPSGGYNTTQQQRPQQSGPGQYQQPAMGGFGGGGFMRGLAGGMLGGFVGSMLFGGLAGASSNGEGTEGGGMGLLDFVLIGLLLYLAYRFFMRRRQAQGARLGQSQYQAEPFGGQAGAGYPPPPPPPGAWGNADPAADLEQGLGHIRSMDPGFDPKAFAEQAGDIFFQIQGAWTRRDLSSVGRLLTPEMQELMQAEADKLKAAGQINRLENIAVRSIDLHQAWQEAGQDYLAVHLLASLLDYTVDEHGGQVLNGSDRDPVKFEELWTFSRPVGPGPWRLSAITQMN